MAKGSRRGSFQHLLQRYLLHEGRPSLYESTAATESHIEGDLDATLQRFVILHVVQLETISAKTLPTFAVPLGWGATNLRCEKRDLKAQFKSIKMQTNLNTELEAIASALRAEGAQFNLCTDGHFLALTIVSDSKVRCAVDHTALLHMMYFNSTGRTELLIWQLEARESQKSTLSFLRVDLEALISNIKNTKIAG